MATSGVTLTAALRANLLSLQGTAKLLDTTQLRLATGRKVNSALDSPSSFFASQALNNRAGDLSNLLDSMGQAIQTLKAADQAITSLTTLVSQAKAIAQSALNQVSSSAFIRSGDIVNTASGANASANNLTGTGGFTANNTFTLSANGATAVTITITSGMTLSQLASSINAQTGFSAQIVDGSVANSSRIEIRATNGATLTYTNGTGTPIALLASGFGVTGGATGREGGGTGTTTLASANVVAATSNALDQIALEKQYQTVINQINTLVTDAGYQGTNLVNGDTLNVQFNERNTSKLSVVGVTFDSTGLGLNAYSANSTFLNSTNITSALNSTDNGLSKLRAQAATFGNNLNIVQARQDFTTSLINNLKEGSDLLTLADKNEEGANLLSLQTAQQLGIQALSLASQANQSVLRLFN